MTDSRTRSADHAVRTLAAIVESSDDAIIAEDLDGTILSWNGGAERMYGYAAEEMIGRPINVIVPPPLVGELSAILERIRAGERVRNFETVRATKDGRLVDVALSISPIRDAAGAIFGASAIARDITERRKELQALKDTKPVCDRFSSRQSTARRDRRPRTHREFRSGRRTPVRLQRR